MRVNQKTVSFSRENPTNPYKQKYFFTCTGDFSMLGNIANKRVWSPIIWKDGERLKENFSSSELIALDFDSGEWTIDDAIKYAEENSLNVLIGVTKSHQLEKAGAPPCDRFRMLIDADTCKSLDDYEYTMRQLCAVVPTDKACIDGARFFYPCKEIVYKKLDGNPAHWLECPYEDTQAARDEFYNAIHPAEYRNLELIPAQILVWLRKGVKPGSGQTAANDRGRHNTCYKIGCYFARRGWSEDECFKFFTGYKSPLLQIGEADVRRAVANAYKRVFEHRPIDINQYRKGKETKAANDSQPGG